MSVAVQTKTAKAMTGARAQWIKERETYIGATDAGAIAGVNPYVSPHDVWLAKKGLSEQPDSIAMRHGIFVESFIAKEYQRVTGSQIRKSRLYRHPKFEYFGCNPDREIRIEGREGLLECKSVGYFASKNFGQDGSDQIPEHYLVQVMWQLMVTGKEFVHLAALVDNRELRIFTYTLDPALSSIAHVFPKETVRGVAQLCGEFWNRYLAGNEEPPMTGHDSDTSWLQQERASYENGQKTNTDQFVDWDCVKLRGAIAREKRAALVVAERKNRIKKFMAERNASVLESTAGEFTWKTNAKGVAVFNTPFRSQNA